MTVPTPFLFAPASATLTQDLLRAERATNAAFPLKRQHREDLPYAVRDLSRLLTSERDLKKGYWASPRLLGAYLRYFLPWNLLRLARLLPSLPLDLNPGGRILDLGSGPLTLPMALWLARPELRTLPLALTASDLAPRPMEIGRQILRMLADEEAAESAGNYSRNSAPASGPDFSGPGFSDSDGRESGPDARPEGKTPWKIRLLRAPLEQAARAALEGAARPKGGASPAPGERRTFDLILAGNVLNELPTPRHGTLEESLGRLFASLDRALEEGGSMLFVEPGTRLGGRLIGLMRRLALARGYQALAPCPHEGACPLLPLPETEEYEDDFFADERPAPPASARNRAQASAQSLDRTQDHTYDGPQRGRPASAGGWCHFNCDSAGAGRALLDLSARAKLEKDRLHLSFVLLRKPGRAESTASGAENPPASEDPRRASAPFAKARPGKSSRPDAKPGKLPCRVLSDPLRLPGQSALGYYLCTPLGLGLLLAAPSAGKALPSGALLQAAPAPGNKRDPKSGALIFEVKG